MLRFKNYCYIIMIKDILNIIKFNFLIFKKKASNINVYLKIFIIENYLEKTQ